jgi:eukaryotic-like serine/threonine-protein kinase
MDSKQWEKFEALYVKVQSLPDPERKVFISRLEIDEEIRDLLIASMEDYDTSEQLFDSLREAADKILREKALEFEHPPESIGAYKIAHKIGRGGSSSVYLATRDNDFRHRIAVKILHLGLEGGTAMNRFYAERSILASLNHPNIASLLDGGLTNDGRPYLFMEYIDGMHIDEYCSANNLSLKNRLEMFLIICNTVGYAHRNLVIHRDIKPSNILVDRDGRVKLLDFGIAKLLDDSAIQADLHETGMGGRVLTPMFSSPEQIRGAAVTTASDVYQLGLLLYRILTGTFPYRRQLSNRYELEQSILRDEPAYPSSMTKAEGYVDPSSLSGDLDQIILKTLEKEAGRRYGSVAELTEDIRRYLGGQPVKAVRPTVSYRTTRFLKRNKSWVIPTLALFVLLAGSVIGLLIQAGTIRTERDSALLLEKLARGEAEKTDQLSEYLIELFTVNDPLQGGSGDITARELLDKGAETLEERFSDQPEIHARFARTLGRIYGNMGLYDQGQQLLDKAVEIYRSQDSKTELARTLAELGDLHHIRRSFQMASDSFLESFKLMESLQTPADHYYILALAGYAKSLRELNKPDSALIYFQIASNLAGNVYEASDNRLANLRIDYAYILRGLDRLDEAEEIYRTELSELRSAGISETETVTILLNNLAYLLRLKEEFDESYKYYGTSLKIHEKIFGEGHPRTVMISNNMATVAYFNDRSDLADSLFNESLERTRNFQDEDHWRLGSAHMALARFYHTIGKYSEADSLFRIAHQIYSDALGEDHDWTTEVLNRHAHTLAGLNRHDEIRPMLSRVIQLTESRYGPDHANITVARDIISQYDLD